MNVNEFDRQWLRKTPRASIKFLVRRLHVGTPEIDVQMHIAERCDKTIGMTPAIKAEALDYAALCHRQNQTLFMSVNRGAF